MDLSKDDWELTLKQAREQLVSATINLSMTQAMVVHAEKMLQVAKPAVKK